MENFAHIDEGGGPLPDGGRLYGMAAVLTFEADQPALRAELRRLVLPGRDHLHHYEETLKRRTEIAQALADMPLVAGIVVTQTTTNSGQEQCRRQLLSWLLPRLQHVEGVQQAIIESRHTNDKHDVRTRNRLRQSRSIDTSLRIDHVSKRDDELLWVADFLVGTYFGALLHDEPEPWEIVTEAHLIELTIDPR